jgi:hypothetical protein
MNSGGSGDGAAALRGECLGRDGHRVQVPEFSPQLSRLGVLADRRSGVAADYLVDHVPDAVTQALRGECGPPPGVDHELLVSEHRLVAENLAQLFCLRDSCHAWAWSMSWENPGATFRAAVRPGQKGRRSGRNHPLAAVIVDRQEIPRFPRVSLAACAVAQLQFVAAAGGPLRTQDAQAAQPGDLGVSGAGRAAEAANSAASPLPPEPGLRHPMTIPSGHLASH